MLIKLIKHDIISLFKRIGLSWLIFGAIILISIPVGRSIEGTYETQKIALVLIALSVACFGFSISGLISSFPWFLSKMFSNEGYLTHTLPARTSTIVLSKMFATLLLSFLGFVLAILSYYLFSMAVFGDLMRKIAPDFPFEFSILLNIVKEMFTGLGMKIALSQFLNLLAFILTGYFSISLAQFLHSGKRGLMATIYFILLSIVFSLLTNYAIQPFLTGTYSGETLSMSQVNAHLSRSFVISYITSGVKIVAFWLGTMGICSKYLNLKG